MNELRHGRIQQWIYLSIVLAVLVLTSGCSSSYKPSELKGYYKPLVQNQSSLNSEDINNKREYTKSIAEGREPSMKYYFEIRNKFYYILQDVVYSKEGSQIIALQPLSEGYFTYNDNLYYVCGEEKEKEVSTLGGPVAYILKGYKYRKLELNKLVDSPIEKKEYEKLYFETSKGID